MNTYIRTLLLFGAVLGNACLVRADEVSQLPSEAGVDTIDPPVIKDAEQSASDDWFETHVEQPGYQVESFVMPFTHWVEDKIQNTDIMKPSVYVQEASPEPAKGIGLRGAIEKARAEFEGTVLSADKITSEGQLVYRVKILSKEGVVKQIEVSDTP